MPAQAPDHYHDHRRTIAWLRAAMLLSLVGPLVVFAWVAWSSHEQTVQEARARLRRVAQVALEHANRVVESNEIIRRGLEPSLRGLDRTRLHAAAPELHERLRAISAGLDQLQSAWIWDDRGAPVATSLPRDPPGTLNVADREYFAWSRANPRGGWYVSEPLRSRTTGEPFVDFSRPLATGTGEFFGVLSVSLRPDYFAAFFREQVQEAPGFAVGLFRADGLLLARFPAATEGARLAADSQAMQVMVAQRETFEGLGTSSIDGMERWVSLRKVRGQPLYVIATAEVGNVVQPWRQATAVLAAFILPLSLGLMALCGFALRRVQREHALALAHDTEREQRARAEEALRQAQKMEALGRLTGGVAHDFNNILMVVQTSASLARALSQRGRPVESPLATIERAVKTGSQLTRQLLSIARRQPLKVRSLELHEELAELASLMNSTLGGRYDVACEIEGPPCRVRVDQSELELAIINLCINARDAMPNGGKVRVCCGPTQAPEHVARRGDSNAWVAIRIVDEGEGIPRELLQRVTEPFFTTKPPSVGSGLGLSQVQSFAHQSGGQLHIESTVGRGTTVTIVLPCTDMARDSAPPPTQPAALEVQGSHVLLVEDNADIASTLRQLFESSGARVTHFPNAEAALQAVRSNAVVPTVVLSDVSLSGALTGVDLARALADDQPGLRVILMTGYTDKLREAQALGFVVLPKPIPPEVVMEALFAQGMSDPMPLAGITREKAT